MDARSHPGVSLAPVLQFALDRLRRFRVRITRCMVLPQKQVGSALVGARPISRKRICAPQDRFGHSHHSSRLFFTNATSARFSVPPRRTCPFAGASRCRSALPTEGAYRLKWFINDNLALGERLPRKRCCSLTIATAAPAVGFHPKFRNFCGEGVFLPSVLLPHEGSRRVGVSMYVRGWPTRVVLPEKGAKFNVLCDCESMFTPT